MISDVIKEVHTSIVERVTSPLLGSFAISWCLWNYKFLLIVFSEEPVVRSFELVSTYAYPDSATLVLKGIVWPLVTTLLYIFAYPYPAKWVYGYTRRRQKELLEIKRRLEDETPLTLEESRRIRSMMRQQSTDFNAERQGFQEEIQTLRDELKKAKEEPVRDPPKAMAFVSRAPISDTQMDLLRKISAGDYSREQLVSKSPDRVRAEFDLEELRGKDLIDPKPIAGSRYAVYRLTHEGRRVLLNED